MSKCSTGKRRFGDPFAAGAALQKGKASPNPQRAEQRLYACPKCFGWHLTSKTRPVT